MDETKLRSIPLFSGLGKKELRAVASHADEVDVPEGESLMQRGSDALRVLRDRGRLGGGPPRRRGRWPGWAPATSSARRRCIERGVRNATVTAVDAEHADGDDAAGVPGDGRARSPSRREPQLQRGRGGTLRRGARLSG